MAKGRGRKSSIQKLPPECDGIVRWANGELRDDGRDEIDIYQEFVDRCRRLMADSHGELEFTIPSKSSFNRYSLRLDALSRRMDETARIANAIAGSFDGASADNVVLIAAMAINSLVFELVNAKGDKVEPKEAKALADALRAATQAQNFSTMRRQRIEKEFAGKVKEAVTTVAKARGFSQETVNEIYERVLGVPLAPAAPAAGA